MESLRETPKAHNCTLTTIGWFSDTQFKLSSLTRHEGNILRTRLKMKLLHRLAIVSLPVLI